MKMLPETPTTAETATPPVPVRAPAPTPLVELSSLTLEGLTRTDRLRRSLECARELALGPMPGHMLR